MGWQMSNYLRRAFLDHALGGDAYTPPADVYLTLVTAVPGPDATAPEVSGGGYTRQVTAWGTAASGSVQSSAGPAWSPLHTGAQQAIQGAMLMDDSTAGNPLFVCAFDGAFVVDAGNPITFDAGWATINRAAGSGMSNYTFNHWLNLVLNGTAWTPPSIWLAEYTTAVDETGAGTEVTGGSYARKTVTWEAAEDPGIIRSDGSVAFRPLHTAADQTVLASALVDASTAGNVLFFADTDFTIAADDNLIYPALSITAAAR